MKRHMWFGAFVIVLIAGARGLGAEPFFCEPARESFLDRFRPVGGWAPYGGGLLQWWNAHCFPCDSGPDDYCRKPLPRVCRPACPASCHGGTSPNGCVPTTGSKPWITPDFIPTETRRP